MENKLKNIFNLSKVFIKENENNLKIINEKNKNINKKSLLFWIYIILFFGITYASNEVVTYMVKIGKPEIFLNGYLLFLQILIILRTIMVSINIFYFSKEIESVLHLPFKPIEILISKFNTILFMVYEIELIFGLIPLFIYGINVHAELLYFINLILILIIFPIFAILIVSIIMIFLMKTIKLFKNKDLMQIIISFILVFLIMFFVNKATEYIFNNVENITENQEEVLNNINEKIIEINKYFVNINPARKILENKNIFKILLYFLELILINLIGFLLFIFLGNKLYLKQLLKANFYYKKKKNKKVKLNKKTRKNKKGISYIKKEFKLLYKNPLFFIQSIYPVILMTVIVSILIIVLVPAFIEAAQTTEQKEILEELEFDIEAACIIIGGIQVVGLFNYTSVTAISREGKNAFVIKYLPVSLFKQIIYKSIPQIFINTICSGIILAVIKYVIPAIEIKYILIMFLISFLLNIINSIILILIDLLMPKLEWDAEYEILRNNKNKLLQYVLIIINILFLIYIEKVFEDYNLDISLWIFIGSLILILFIFNFIIWKFKNKLFKKIN